MNLEELMQSLEPHDHLCLIYESPEEWERAVVPFMLSGLKKGEKCVYIVDANTARQVKKILKNAGLDVTAAEKTGQLQVIHEKDSYTRDGFFDPDAMIKLLISETEKALKQGYPALRATGEMSWALRGYTGSDRLLEYESRLNSELFLHYPCLAICQYDRWKFDPEIIKGVVLTHPFLIRGDRIYRNFYYIEPEEYLNHKKSGREVQHWLNNLERERQFQEVQNIQEEELRRQNELLLSLTARGTWGREDLKSAVAEIIEACAELIQVERVSVWWYNDDCSIIRCFDLYEKSKNRHSEGEELPSSKFPLYADSHKRGEIITTDDVYADPRTSSIPGAYYEKYGIKSLLDAPVWLHDRIGGLLSFEHVGEQRHWTPGDERLATSIAALISLSVEAAERKQAIEMLQESEERYRKLAESTDAILWEYDIPSDRWTYVAPR